MPMCATLLAIDGRTTQEVALLGMHLGFMLVLLYSPLSGYARRVSHGPGLAPLMTALAFAAMLGPVGIGFATGGDLAALIAGIPVGLAVIGGTFEAIRRRVGRLRPGRPARRRPIWPPPVRRYEHPRRRVGEALLVAGGFGGAFGLLHAIDDIENLGAIAWILASIAVISFYTEFIGRPGVLRAVLLTFLPLLAIVAAIVLAPPALIGALLVGTVAAVEWPAAR